MTNSFKTVPVWNNGEWTEREFSTREDFRDYVFSMFKEPGQYELDETTRHFRAQAEIFEKEGMYCSYPDMTKDFIDYWEFEKKKSRNGVIFINGDKEWYLPRDYYFWINFLPIYDKIKHKTTFAQIWDVQLHMALYELLAELNYKHAVIVKKRQIASSYFHCAKLINAMWFEEGANLKIGASQSDLIGIDKGSWKYLDEYRNFLNTHTAWIRPMNPCAVGKWVNKYEVNDNGRIVTKGLKSSMSASSFEKSPTASVGGPCHRLGTKILMSNGRFKEVENIKVGDYILGEDSKPKIVKRTFSGEADMYHVIPKRGKDFYATGDHLLSLFTNDQKVHGNRERLVKVSEWCNLTNYQKERWVQKRNNKILEFDEKTNCTLDPYFLGLWLGDGYRQMVGLIVNKTYDPEIIDYCNELSSKLKYPLVLKRKEEERYKNVEMYSCYFPISQNHIDGPLTKEFIKYNLFYNKHIPDEYLYGSVEVRKQLLAGIIDTDGHFLSEHYRFEISQKNDKLFNQIVFLARSLGAIVHTRKVPSQEHLINGRLIKYTSVNSCAISFYDPSIIPTRIKRKKCCRNKVRTINTSPIRDVQKVGFERYAGIEVEDEHYFLEDLTLTHNCLYFFHEEAGIAPLMDKTYLYMKPSMQMGEITTGMFIAAGSVGELKSCEPLKEFMLNPEINDFYAVENHYIDEEGKIGKTGLFIPEQWGMPPYIDEFGNSLVEDALKALADRYELIKKTKDPASYQLEISQHPRYLSEAFAYRDISIFPTNVIKDQLTRIEDNEFPYELVNLEEDANGEIIVTRGTHSPIKEWPVKKADPDKEGAIQVWERPDEEIIYNEYIASIDPVKPVKTISSDSLNSIYVYKMPIRVNKRTANGTENFIEGGKIVCCWAGRFDNPKKNHQRMELILKWYKCKAIVEANVQDFINYMVEKNLGQRHLVKKSEMIFLKEYNLNTMTFNEYGWKNTTTIFKTVMLPFLINFLNEVILEEYDDEGNITKVVHGVRRIPDKMVLMEMLGYSESKNVDRIVSLTALVCYLKAQEANHMAPVRYETDNNLENDRKLYKLKMSPFNLSNKQGLGYKKKLFSKLW